MPPEAFFSMPPRKRKKLKTDTVAATAASPVGRRKAQRWRWLRLENGAEVAERLGEDWQRAQAEADMYGNTPMLSTGAHMRTIDSLITEVASSLNIQEQELAPELLQQAWYKAVGAFLATQAELVGLAEGLATIRTSHPAVRFELQRRKQHILSALNRELGEGCVQTVRILHG